MSIYNHRSLQPTGPPGPPGALGPAGAGPSGARLMEILDNVKQEFDLLGQDNNVLRSQKLEYELKVSDQVTELNIIRQSLYELETQHTKLRQQYEEELGRLRSELTASRTAAAQAATAAGSNPQSLASAPLPPPPPSSSQPPPSSTGPSPPLHAPPPHGLGGPQHSNNLPQPMQGVQQTYPENYFSGRDRDRDNRERDLPSSTRESKRLKSDKKSGDHHMKLPGSSHHTSPHSHQTSPHMLPGASSLASRHHEPRHESGNGARHEMGLRHDDPPIPNSNLGGGSLPERDRMERTTLDRGILDRDRERPERGDRPERERIDRSGPPLERMGTERRPGGGLPPAASIERPLQPVSAPANNMPYDFPGELEPHALPSELKKEGLDWFALFNGRVKRSLDVTLTHTFMHESVVCCVRFSSDGKYLATGCNRTAQIFDTKTGAKTCVLADDGASKQGDLYIRSVCFSPDGKYLATGAEDKQIRIWDIGKKRIRNIFEGHSQEIYSLDFSRDGRLIVSGSGDKTARIWDMETGACTILAINEPEPADAGVTSVAISPDGRWVAAGSLDTIVRVWDVVSGVLVERLKGHSDSVYSVAFTPDGKGLVSGSLDKTLKYWDLSGIGTSGRGSGRGSAASSGGKDGSGSKCTMNFAGHKDYVLSVAVSHDGQWVVSGSKDRGVQFWDSRTATTQLMLQGHKNSVISIDLSPAGGILATGSGDWQARLWTYTQI